MSKSLALPDDIFFLVIGHNSQLGNDKAITHWSVLVKGQPVANSKLELCRAHTPCACCTICRYTFSVHGYNFVQLASRNGLGVMSAKKKLSLHQM